MKNLVIEEDYYIEEGRIVLTEKYHKKEGDVVGHSVNIVHLSHNTKRVNKY